MLKIIINFMTIFFCLSSTAFCFELDLTLGQMKKLDGQTIIDDLSVGEKRKIESRAFCFKEKHLYLSPTR